MAKEIIIRASSVSPELTGAACVYLLREFGGFFMAAGIGGYTFEDGRVETAPAISWHIGTGAKDSERLARVSEFAKYYCGAGEQESVYFLDSDGAAYLVFADGHFSPLDSAPFV